MLQTLIDLAKQIRAEQARGEVEGLTEEEIALYDALADNDSADDIMGNDSLKVIAAELVNTLRASATVDRSHRESARPDAGAREADPSQIRVCAGPSGHRDANRDPAGGAMVDGERSIALVPERACD